MKLEILSYYRCIKEIFIVVIDSTRNKTEDESAISIYMHVLWLQLNICT